ncbi:MAG: TRAP transporter small permease subunit [Candidatus Competibacteraceae bacterium]|nr:TRAP transporter small permease subunit [Candidatus Competibacteraceae bacterium]MCB1814555.1 TRAP transporter small permease subunit [Candidatus Competibacteraceae bacterium]
MPKAVRIYVHYVDALSRVVGKFAMYLIFAMMGILLFGSISRAGFNTPHIWVVEMAQFTMAAYYLLGGGYSMLLDAHVRVDIFYGRWPVRKQAFADSITAFCLIFYLVFLLVGGLSSTEYALEYGQKNYSSWGPPLAPIKIIMTFGILLMLLQAISMFFKDWAAYKGKEIAKMEKHEPKGEGA